MNIPGLIIDLMMSNCQELKIEACFVITNMLTECSQPVLNKIYFMFGFHKLSDSLLDCLHHQN